MRCVLMPQGSKVERRNAFGSMDAAKKMLAAYAGGTLNVVQMSSLKDMNALHWMMFDAASATTAANEKATTLYRASHPDERPALVIVGPVLIMPDTDIAAFYKP